MEPEKQVRSNLQTGQSVGRRRTKPRVQHTNIGRRYSSRKRERIFQKESQQEAAHETLQKIKNDPQFIDAIFASKAEREKDTEPVYTEDSPSVMETNEDQTIDVREELITERYDDTERIIAEAEEAAFKEEIQEKTSADSEEERI